MDFGLILVNFKTEHVTVTTNNIVDLMAISDEQLSVTFYTHGY